MKSFIKQKDHAKKEAEQNADDGADEEDLDWDADTTFTAKKPAQSEPAATTGADENRPPRRRPRPRTVRFVLPEGHIDSSDEWEEPEVYLNMPSDDEQPPPTNALRIAMRRMSGAQIYRRIMIPTLTHILLEVTDAMITETVTEMLAARAPAKPGKKDPAPMPPKRSKRTFADAPASGPPAAPSSAEKAPAAGPSRPRAASPLNFDSSDSGEVEVLSEGPPAEAAREPSGSPPPPVLARAGTPSEPAPSGNLLGLGGYATSSDEESEPADGTVDTQKAADSRCAENTLPGFVSHDKVTAKQDRKPLDPAGTDPPEASDVPAAAAPPDLAASATQPAPADEGEDEERMEVLRSRLLRSHGLPTAAPRDLPHSRSSEPSVGREPSVPRASLNTSDRSRSRSMSGAREAPKKKKTKKEKRKKKREKKREKSAKKSKRRAHDGGAVSSAAPKVGRKRKRGSQSPEAKRKKSRKEKRVKD